MEACLGCSCGINLKIEVKVLIHKRVESGFALPGRGSSGLSSGKGRKQNDVNNRTEYERQGSFDHSML